MAGSHVRTLNVPEVSKRSWHGLAAKLLRCGIASEALQRN